MTLDRTNQSKYGLSVLCLTVVSLAAMVVAGCGAKSASVSASGEGGADAAMPVQVQVVEAKPIAETTEYLALLKSRHSATINPQVEGYITRIFVKSGDHVAAGEALLQIDPLKQEATVNSQDATRLAQEANVNLSRVNLERSKKLAEAGVISKMDLDNAQTNYDNAVAQLKSLEHQVEQQKVELRYYRVSAPMAGVVGDIPVRMGDRVIVSTLLTTVDEPGALEAYLYIPAARAKDLRLGLPVKLLDEAGNVRTASQVTFISPQVDPDTQTVLAKAAVPNPKANLRIAQQVRAQVVWGNASGPVVPVLAVTRINGQFFVFVAEKEAKGTIARQRGVKVGEIIGNDYAVLDGLKPGEHLIVSGTQFLQDGAPVSEQIQPAGPKAESTPKTGK
ncbi:MAG TPA: efflux RND transporter periplasmic adaptor subunit [Candidatus Acidoferrum sp.]|jgi:RND family efflux transporter MFP subunit|nr:efflux RND transporter periplasmic adaptor subunit [Candidatus Acidoferrum sp.]